jgi:thioredoxin reductase (NADPH)
MFKIQNFPKSQKYINLYLKYSRRMLSYQYDLFVIGGGSGGLAASKEAANLGAKVGLADYVKPTPIGTKWGLGGTCVNVGCIPKKMMHHAANLYEDIDELKNVGFHGEIKKTHDWESMVNNIQTYIKKLNYGYRSDLRSKKVVYYNKLAKLLDKNTIELTDAKGAKETVTAKNILLAVGGRPNYGDAEGAKECCITSDDIFSLKKSPGKTLVVGASYIALVNKK